MGILIAYVVPIVLIIITILLARHAKQAPTYGNYTLALALAIFCGAYAKLAELAGMPIGGDSIGAGIAIVIVLIGIGFGIWSVGMMTQKAFRTN